MKVILIVGGGVGNAGWNVGSLILCCGGRNYLVVVALIVSTRRSGYGWSRFGRVVTGSGYIDVDSHGKKVKKRGSKAVSRGTRR